MKGLSFESWSGGFSSDNTDPGQARFAGGGELTADFVRRTTVALGVPGGQNPLMPSTLVSCASQDRIPVMMLNPQVVPADVQHGN
jgi:hypothetical protein